MRPFSTVLILVLATALAAPVLAADLVTLEAKFPSLSSGPLRQAVLADLPADVLLTWGDIKITKADIDSDLLNYKPEARAFVTRYLFFALENLAVDKMLKQEAKAWAVNKSLTGLSEKEMVTRYFQSVAATAKVSEAEVAQFYWDNKDMFEGRPYADVSRDVRSYLEDQKRQDTVNDFIDAVSSRVAVRVSESWVAPLYRTWIKNPVETARRAGKPVLVEFGSVTCMPCKTLAPIIDALRTKHKDNLNVLNIDIDKEPVLASHYNALVVPKLIIYDTKGAQTWDFEGFSTKSSMERIITMKLADVGVK